MWLICHSLQYRTHQMSSDHFQIPSYSFLDFHIRSRCILDAVSLLFPMTDTLVQIRKRHRSQVQLRASGDSLGSRGRAELWARLYGINLFAEATVLALVWFNFIKQMLRKYSLSLSLWCQLTATFLSHSIGSLLFLYLLSPTQFINNISFPASDLLLVIIAVLLHALLNTRLDLYFLWT